MSIVATVFTLLPLLVSGPERDNHRGYESWTRKDTASALESFEKAARKDSTRSDYAFNLGTAKTLSGKDGEADLTRAVTLSKTPSEKARALYNRGTARLAKALSAPQGQGDPSGAISDLRDALKLRPGWNEAARNLDRALRMRPPPDPKQCPNPKNQDKQNDQKQDKKDQKPQDGKDQQPSEPKEQEQKQPQPQSGMDPRDAQRLLDGASAREAQQARERSRQKQEGSDAQDW